MNGQQVYENMVNTIHYLENQSMLQWDITSSMESHFKKTKIAIVGKDIGKWECSEFW